MPPNPQAAELSIPHGFETRIITAAMSWLWREPADSSEPLVLDCIGQLQRLVAEQKRSQRDTIPHDVDRAIIKLSVRFLVNQSALQLRAKITERWVQLRLDNARWHEEFVNAIYRTSIEQSPRPAFIVETLRDVLNSFLSEDGPLCRDETVDHVDDLAKALIGWDSVVPPDEQWPASHTDIADALRDQWRRWCDVAITWYDAARVFLRIARTPAFKNLRVDAMLWAFSAFKRWRREEEAYEEATSLLEQIWTEHPEQLKAHREEFEAFVRTLAELRNARAILLAQRIATGS